MTPDAQAMTRAEFERAVSFLTRYMMLCSDKHEAVLAHDAAQRATVERLETELKQQKSSLDFFVSSKDTLLQAFCNLQITYGEQKHKIRQLTQQLAALRTQWQDSVKYADDQERELEASQARCAELEAINTSLNIQNCQLMNREDF